MNMKSHKLILAAMAIVALAACTKEGIVPGSIDSKPEVAPDPWTIIPVEVKDAPAGPTLYTQASILPGSKSGLSMNESGTHASVVWHSGDSFSEFFVSNETIYKCDYTTSENNVESAEFTTTSSRGNSDAYYGVYPNSTRGVSPNYNGKFVIGVNIPTIQTAIAGDIADGLNLSYYKIGPQEKNRTFTNLVSIIKFRIAGDNIYNVTKIRFATGSYLTGDCVALVGDDSAELTFSLKLKDGEQRSNYVELTGEFRKGKDYYMVVAPGVLTGYSMVFSDDNGNSTTLSSAKTLTLQASRMVDFGTIDIGNEFTDSKEDIVVNKIHSATAGAPYPVTLVFVAEGFTADKKELFGTLSATALAALFNTEPYKTYQSYFNVYSLFVPSNENGASISDGNGNITTARDSYFGAYWGSDSYGDMSLNTDKLLAFVSDNCPDIVSSSQINEVAIAVIINDSRYGGICHMYSNGRGFAMIPYISNGSSGLSWTYNSYEAVSDSDPSAGTKKTDSSVIASLGGSNIGSWTNVLVHEFGGHCFGRFGDEYWSSTSTGSAIDAISAHSWQVKAFLNISAKYSPTPWDNLLSKKDELVASDSRYSRIDTYQGGQGNILNRWRCEKVSCMMDNRFYFSTWQRMLIVKRIKSLAGESFDEEDFFSRDVTTDPNRDVPSAAPAVVPASCVPSHPMPMLPPPVLHEE